MERGSRPPGRFLPIADVSGSGGGCGSGCGPAVQADGAELVAPAGVVDGRQVFQVNDHEALFSADGFDELQPFAGAWLPRLPGRTAYPHPERVGEYVPYSEFAKIPKYMAQWVHWKDRADMVLAGRYHELPAAHFEGIFTLVCNFMCPHCSRRVTRTKWVEGGTWEHNTDIEKKNTMHPEGLRLIRADRRARGWRGWAQLLNFQFGRIGALRKLFLPWLDYFKPGFHPWQHDNRAFLSQIDAVVAEVEARPPPPSVQPVQVA